MATQTTAAAKAAAKAAAVDKTPTVTVTSTETSTEKTPDALTPDVLANIAKHAKGSVFTLGADSEENRAAIAALLGDETKFPIRLRVTNEMPRPVVLPVVPGLSLGHCAGVKEKRSCVVVVRSEEMLGLLANDVENILSFNDTKGGLLLQLAD